MKTHFLLWLLTGISTWLCAQAPYTSVQFEVREESDIAIGTQEDFQGQPVPLFLDLYKPVGDDNCLRPLLLMIHGGAWVAGTRKDPEVVSIAREMASMGYAVASLEYRLGHHKSESYTQYAACLTDRCVYIADTSEIYRAVFRGVQDAWSALRFLSGRRMQDSTDIKNVFVGGVSAGGFVALQTALWEDPSRRPLESFELPDIPAPDPELWACYSNPQWRRRPDMGQARDGLWMELEAPVIRGIANFYGAIFKPEQLEALRGKPLYLFHQTNDLIVDCGRGKVLGPIYQHCLNPLNLCDRDMRMPIALGSCSIISENENRGLGVEIFADIQENGPPNGLACLANPPTHSILNIVRRCSNMARHFAPWITASGNDPDSNCIRITPVFDRGIDDQIKPVFYPNPAMDHLYIDELSSGSWQLSILSLTGQPVRQYNWKQIDKVGSHKINLLDLTPGLYILHLTNGRNHHFKKWILSSEW